MSEFIWASPSDKPDFHKLICDIVTEKIYGHIVSLKEARSLAVFKNDTLMAGFYFSDYYPEYGRIEISAAAFMPRWLSRKLIEEIYFYVFTQMKCQVLIAHCSSSNQAVQNIAKKMGFNSIRLPRLRGRDHDEIQLTLFDDSLKKFDTKRG